VRDPVSPGSADDRYPTSAAAANTRLAVSALTRPGRAKARETVDAATPAARATS
jgi:hypothetical protein